MILQTQLVEKSVNEIDRNVNKLEEEMNSNVRIMDSMNDRVHGAEAVDPGFQKRPKDFNPSKYKLVSIFFLYYGMWYVCFMSLSSFP